MDTYKMKARCIGITDRNGDMIKGVTLGSSEEIDGFEVNSGLKIILKDNRGNIETFGPAYILDKVASGDLSITNLDVVRDKNKTKVYLVRDTNTLLNRGLEDDSQEAQDRALHIFEKSKLVGACHVDSSGVLNHGSYDKIMITDKSNKISGDIQANEIWIDGSMDLVRVYTSFMLSIKCDKLVIKNPMAMINLRSDCIIHIRAEHIEIKHRFVDLNTVIEMLYLYNHTYRNCSKQIITKFQDVTIEFDKEYHKEIIKITLEILKEIFEEFSIDLETLISALYWAKCMWQSTGQASMELLNNILEYKEYILKERIRNYGISRGHIGTNYDKTEWQYLKENTESLIFI